MSTSTGTFTCSLETHLNKTCYKLHDSVMKQTSSKVKCLYQEEFYHKFVHCVPVQWKVTIYKIIII